MRTRRKYWAHNTCSLFLPLICHLGVLFTASFFVHSKLWGFCQAIVWKESLEEVFFFFKVAIGPFEAVGWQVWALILHHRNGTPPHRNCHLPNYRRLCAVHPRQPPTNRGSFWAPARGSEDQNIAKNISWHFFHACWDLICYFHHSCF